MNTIIITFADGSKKEYAKGVKLSDVIEDMEDVYKSDIVCALYQNKLIGFNDSLSDSGLLIFFDLNSKIGNIIYERGLTVLFSACVREVLGKDTVVKVRHSIDRGVFCEIHSKKLDNNAVKQIKNLMQDKVNKAIPFLKVETTKVEAMEYFKKNKRYDKVKALFFDKSLFITLYKFDGNYYYILAHLPSDTSVFKHFDLTLLEGKGIVLRYPSVYDNGRIVKYTHHENYFNSIEEYNKWAEILNISNIGELNEAIVNNDAGEVIQLSEMIQNYKLLSIAEEIKSNKKNIKLVLLSGPTSSGKTTTSKKLSLYLKTLGMKPLQLSLDDYFLDRDKTPLDENGNPDFESLRAIDVRLFNSQMEKLLKGTKVIVPRFDFKTGKKVYEKHVQMDEDTVLVIEGLHALNDQLLTNIQKKNKYKIYVSPLSFINLDDDNRISITDIRLLRRIVRDNRTRGYKPEHTLAWWDNVRTGEEKYVFPFQDSADVIFNSSLAYELGVIKTYVEPLLYSVKSDSKEYASAVRLLETLKSVLAIPGDSVPDVSILREFIGGSFFE